MRSRVLALTVAVVLVTAGSAHAGAEDLETFAHPPAAPSPFSYVSAEPRFAVYGWRVAIARSAAEFAELADADASGFTLRGSGTATVMTPAHYRPGSECTVTMGETARALHADAAGRLEIEVPLGPPNAGQQYRLGSATRTFAARVTIAVRGTRAGRRVTTTLRRRFVVCG